MNEYSLAKVQLIIVIVTRGIVTYEMSLFSTEKFYKKNT